MQHLVFRTDNTSQIKPDCVSDQSLNIPLCSAVFSGVPWKTDEFGVTGNCCGGNCMGFLLAQGLEKGKQGQRAHVYMEKARFELLRPVS